MNLYLRLAWRNIWRHKRRTAIIVLAMSMSLSLMMFYDGLMNGFTDAIYGNAVKVLGGNIQVHAEGYRAEVGSTPLLPLTDAQAVVSAAEADPTVLAATQRINTGGLVTNREGAFAVVITGIEPEKEVQVNLIGQYVTAGRNLVSDDVDNILIGKGLADAMDVTVGDRITMVGRSQNKEMRQRTMTIVGIYDLGMADIEKQTVYISLTEAQTLYDLTAPTEVAIFLQHLGQEDEVIKSLQASLPGYEIESFQANYPDLANAIDSKGGVMNVFSVIIIAIAGVGILNLLLMAVYERTREIGVLGAMGLKANQIALLFILEGTMIGLVGVAAGIVLGLALNGYLMKVGMDFGSMTQAASYMALIKDKVYPTWGVEKLLMRASMVAIISALASVIPAIEAGRREPAEALHFV
ncbi:MAG: ABC transporter permease [Anaerolineales bacterium]|jgi:ABC-type lipoprotein release transport system permease subunit|uniref:ABC transporter permease n=1 Tax=Candidatus Villigracilis vicinus TaxID=3140679 RepID=UPI0031346669|nr:ABC transporter permease [Anaerolineales bacterium]MBK7451297.1 ABC transporter permease [Anaerolineales bacterium]MBK9779532.1 ABC transporter permease [Anaerolineales bacterium]